MSFSVTSKGKFPIKHIAPGGGVGSGDDALDLLLLLLVLLLLLLLLLLTAIGPVRVEKNKALPLPVQNWFLPRLLCVLRYEDALSRHTSNNM